MARVRFLPAQRAYTGGVGEIELEAANYRALALAIQARFPAFPRRELEACAVAIDGTVVNRPLLEPLGADSEVVLLPRMGAG